MTTTTAKKKTRVVDPDKAWVNLLKRTLGSLSARACPYAFFNIYQDGVLLCNSKSPPPNNDTCDRIITYGTGDLGLHFIKWKGEFYQELTTWLGVIKTYPIQLLITKLTTLLGKYPKSKLRVENDGRGNIWVIPPHQSRSDVYYLGGPVPSFHAITNLLTWNKQVALIGTEEFEKQLPHATIPFPKEVNMCGREYSLTFSTEMFKDKDGVPYIHHVHNKMTLSCLDGISTVAIREYVKKLTCPYEHNLYVWLVDHKYFLTLITFEDPDISVRTFRPNVRCIPLPDALTIEDKNLLNFTEETENESDAE